MSITIIPKRNLARAAAPQADDWIFDQVPVTPGVRFVMDRTPVVLSNSPCGRPGGRLAGYGGWWFWRRRHHQLGSYLGRIRSEPALACRPAEELGRALLLSPKLRPPRPTPQQPSTP